MSTSSAPAATAYFTSASLTSRLVRPLGNAVATLATCTPLPLSWADATWARSGYTHTAATIGGVGSAGLGAQRADLARRVLPLQRGQVDHRDRGVECPLLGRGLDGPAGQHGRSRLRPHPVHPGQPVQEPSQLGPGLRLCGRAHRRLLSLSVILTCNGELSVPRRTGGANGIAERLTAKGMCAAGGVTTTGSPRPPTST